ncbi:hypothetical protein KIW84_061161 [Lathyrus oleraceus]|uniref:Uncharacterized protein n=1 Tax=Pisum sativum TaxID=3888 RepID=A0A9D5A6C2_PEA|nr:hypothetical protein KIW84_061161 [Pisum sativum]
MVRAWRKIHKKGRNELGPKNCIALEPYTTWVRKRASEYLMPYDYPRPTPLVVAGPSTLPNQGSLMILMILGLLYFLSLPSSGKGVPAASAHFMPAMPVGFPWGMPPGFMPDIPAPTFASMSASSPVLAMPPPVVHTIPRVDDTIYHSEPSEGPDVNEKMDAMNDQFLELRKELKTL